MMISQNVDVIATIKANRGLIKALGVVEVGVATIYIDALFFQFELLTEIGQRLAVKRTANNFFDGMIDLTVVAAMLNPAKYLFE